MTNPPPFSNRHSWGSRNPSVGLAAVFSALAASILVLVAGSVAPPVSALGTPDIVLTKTADTATLIGDATTVTLRACNPIGQPNGYNLAFRDVVPAGLVVLSATPAPSRQVANQPAANQTTLIWENVADLLTGGCVTVSYQLDTNADANLATNPVGSTFGTIGGAYVNSDAFTVPDFDAAGQPSTDITGSDTDGPTTTTIVAFVAEKDAGNNGEGELTRGVHGADPKTYTLRVRNNPDAATNDFAIVDVLPPTLEFLGCASYGAAGYTAGTDNTVDAPTNQDAGAQPQEYPGSGRMSLGAAAATCLEPTTIETLVDGSTRVSWSIADLGAAGDLAANGQLLITYLAGIPMRANTDTWPNGKPTDASLGQGRNLDNNSGTATSETATELGVTNTLTATGTYQGPSTSGPNPTLSDTVTATVTSEDLVIRKSTAGQVVQGTTVTTSLVVETGEYRDFTNLKITDTLPDGLCPLSTPAVSTDTDCGAGTIPTITTSGGTVNAPFTSAVENANGTWTLVWDQTTIPGLAALAHDSTLTITFVSRVRGFYQQNGAPEPGRPILNFDSLTNSVAIEALDFKRSTISTAADPEVDNQLDFDVSSAPIEGVGPSIDKRVSQRTGALANGANLSAATIGDTCRDGTGIVWRDGDTSVTGDGAVTGYGPGDFVCFDLRASFPANVDAAGVAIADLLPASFEYVASSARRVTAAGNGPADTLGSTSVTADTSGVNDVITFEVAGSGGLVPSSPTGQQFHWTIAARLLDPNLSTAYDISANLMKMTTRNSNNDVFQFRDQSSAEWTEPQVKLDKSNNAVGVKGIGDTIDFSIKVWNDGNVDALNAEIWDRLPLGIPCASVSAITPASGVCASGIIKWPSSAVPTVARATTLGTAPVELTYRVTLPVTVDPGRTFTNTAGVRQYEATTNAAGTPFIYKPSSNIDPTVVANTGPASDTSSFATSGATNTKIQQSSVNDAPSNPANSPAGSGAETATIGETITYTITSVIPANTTVIDARLSDALDADLVLHATPTWTFNGVAADPAWVLTAPVVGSGGTVRIDRAGTYSNDAVADTLVLTIVARVSNAAGTDRADLFPNTAAFSWSPAPVFGPTRSTVNSNTTTGNVREPNPTILKDEDDPDDIVGPNDVLNYTLTVNNTGTNVVRVHDLVVVDTIPAGVTVVNGVTPVADGGTVGTDLGIWNAGARTITWDSTTTAAKLTSIAAGGSTTLGYRVVVDDPATSGSIFTNNVTVTGSSLAGPQTGERSYNNSTSDTVRAPAASLAKSVNPLTATIGDTVTYTVDATVPAGTTAYDATVLDTMPDGIDFRAYGNISYVGTSTGCPSLATAQGLTNQTANPDGSTTVGFWLGDITAPLGNSCVIRITYTARVDDTYVPEGTPVVTSTNLTNSARLYWNSSNTVVVPPVDPPAPGGFARNAGPATATVAVREPVVQIDKDISQTGCDQTPGNAGDSDTCATDIGSSYTYTLTIRNTGNWPAYDVSVVDAPDADLVNIVVPPSSGTITVVDGTVPNLEWLIPGPIAAGSSVTITYTAALAASSTLNDGEQIVNTADVPTYYAESAVTRAADPVADWRTYGQGGAGGDVAADTVTMTVGFPNVTVAKTAISDTTDARAGTPFDWRVVATNQTAEPTAPAYNVDIDDALPAGWVYVNNSASVTTPYGTVLANPVCTPNCTTAGAALRWPNVVSGLAQPLAPGAAITIDFQATPQASLLAIGTTGTFDHVNTAGVDAEDVTGATSNLDGPFGGPDDTATARIRRTDLSVDKAVTAGPYTFGSNVDWTITLDNAGPDVATNVTLADVLPVGLVYVSTVSSTQGTYDSGTGVWTVGTVANGATHTLVIRTRLNQIGAITNRSEVKTNDQWDVDSTPSDQGAVADEDDDDTVTIIAGSTSLGDYVWYDIDGNSVVDVGEPGIPNVRLMLESAGLDDTFGTADDFFGPDGVAGGGDDIIVTDAFTNATGFYGFSDLPTGRFRVVVDTATLPGGMTATFNDDAPNTADPDLDDSSGTITLTSTGYLAADFGYTGTGSLGDTLWLDKDASGDANIQAGEPGIPGIDVTLEWGGPDGDLSTAADNVTFPIDTTDGSGQYGFSLLPAGPYRVTVDSADLPIGVAATYDLDGIATAGVTVTSLTGGQNRDDVDFSFAGTGSIGDRIWYDIDGDGTEDLDEPGLAGIDVTVTWLGVDGVPGGDDVVFTAVTDADGNYLVDHLPAGNFTVAIDDTDLPAGMVPTYDLDGVGTAHLVSTSLTSGQNRDDVDFGYRGVASVGDQVWFDIDGDGADAPQIGDPGLPGLPVSVRWSGADGVLDTSDDVVIITVTDSTGNYLVANLPYGPVRISLDPTELPGFVPTFDGDGIGTADQVELTLSPDDVGTIGVDEANPRTADFAYTGTGSIGDLVWEDADANGLLDGAETGLAAVAVTVTWAGLDGLDGTSDDVVFTTTTDAAGVYTVDRLPAGSYTVVVDTSTVAPGLVIVSELDTTLDSRSDLVLLPGEHRTDVDFGYQLQADLSIEKSHVGAFEIGENGVYTIVVANLGPAPALTPTVTDLLPTGLSYVDASGVGAVCSATGQTVTCELVTMAVDDTITIELTVAISAAAAPDVINTASVASTTVDPDTTNNSDDDPTEVPLADLSIDKSHAGDFEVGENGVYTIVVTNLGPSPALTPTVTDVLPTGLSYVDASGVGAVCSATGQTVTCELVTMAVDDTITIELTVAISAAAAPGVVNSASVVSPTQDPDTTNNSDDDPTEVPLADLTLSKRLVGQLVTGSVVGYEIVATNLGPSPSGGPLVITDVLPVGLAFVEAGGDRSTCSAVGQTVTCRTGGSVAVGEAITITIRVRVTATGGQQIANTASVVAVPTLGGSPSAGDPVTANNDATATAIVTAPTFPRTGSSGIGGLVTAALAAIALGVFALGSSRRRRSIWRG